MNQKENPQSVIDKYSKRQKYMPYVLGGLAGILALAGIFIIISVATGSGNLFKGMFATKTPTPTATFTPTATVPSPTPSMTPTITETPTPAATDTPSGPQFYTVKQGDDCWTLANTFGVDLLVLLAINNFPSGTCLSFQERILSSLPPVRLCQPARRCRLIFPAEQKSSTPSNWAKLCRISPLDLTARLRISRPAIILKMKI